jgi:CRISPR/Cas system CSM-associated protein Csm3 (group 7 of RAMP superfamily)
MSEIETLKVKTTALSPIRVGAKRSPMGVTDSPVVKIGEKYTIPGSTLKGALRSKIEEYLMDKYADNPEMKSCIPTSRNTISKEEQQLINSGKYRPDGSCEYPKTNSICPACYFLGANGLVGFVSIPFLYTDNPAELMYSVRIDRAKGTAADRTNRDYQILPQGTVFKGDIEIILEDTVKGWKLGHKRKTLQGDMDKWLEETSIEYKKKFSEMEPNDLISEFIKNRLFEISQLGGFKSKGAGKVKIEIEDKK